MEMYKVRVIEISTASEAIFATGARVGPTRIFERAELSQRFRISDKGSEPCPNQPREPIVANTNTHGLQVPTNRIEEHTHNNSHHLCPICITFLDDAAWQVREREPSNIHPRKKPRWELKKSPIDTIVLPILFKLQAIAWTDFICVHRDPPPTFGNCLAPEIIKPRRQRAAIMKKCTGV